MPDVYQSAKSAGGLPNNGSIIVYADEVGNIKKIDPKINSYQIIAQSGILDNRFDDKTYYST